LALPHVAHTLASGLPHSPQNFRPASFSVPQAGQITSTPLEARYPEKE
jgi:hypothetical protein